LEIQTWLIMTFAATLLWGVSGIFSKLSTPRLGVARVALLVAAVEGTLYSVAFLTLRDDDVVEMSYVLLGIGSCLLGIMGYLCFFEAIMEGQVSIAGTITAAYPALSVIGAVLIIQETLSWVQALGVICIIAGIVGLSFEPNPGSKTAMSRRTLFFALAGFVLWGAWSLTSKIAIDNIGAGNIFGCYVVSSLTAPLIYGWIRRVRPVRNTPANPSRRVWALGAAGLGVNLIGAIAFSFALEGGTASLVVPISSAYPMITVALAVALLKERIDRLHIVPLVIVVIGLVLVGVTV